MRSVKSCTRTVQKNDRHASHDRKGGKIGGNRRLNRRMSPQVIGVWIGVSIIHMNVVVLGSHITCSRFHFCAAPAAAHKMKSYMYVRQVQFHPTVCSPVIVNQSSLVEIQSPSSTRCEGRCCLLPFLVIVWDEIDK